MHTFMGLPEVGAAVTLLIHMVLREDAQLCMFWLSAKKKGTFRPAA